MAMDSVGSQTARHLNRLRLAIPRFRFFMMDCLSTY
jgi:hypothetical protein